MKTCKRALSVLLVAVMLLSAAPMAGFVGLEISDFDFNLSADAAEIVKSGTCGTNVTYTLDSDGLLIIAGTGAMRNYSSSSVPWYSNRSAIKTVIIKNGVTSIGNSAFSVCDSLASVTIPDSVTSIGYYAFYRCTSLTSVTIPDSVTSIGNSAFSSCDSLTSVTIPDSVTSIGNSAFSGCDLLTSVTIPDSVTSIGYRAFCYCTSLTDITVDADNTTYCSEDGVLFNKSKTELIQYPVGNVRTSYTIPDSVTSIGGSAFNGCDSLTSVTIPDSVTSIGGSAFSDCDSLTSVAIGDSVTSIGEYAFEYCYSLGEIVIENKDCQIYDSSNTIPAIAVIRGHDDSTAQSYAEEYNRGFVSIDGAGSGIILSGYCGDNADFTLTRGGTLHITGTGAVYSYNPSTTRPWYKYRGFIRTVIIDDGITEIGNYAFSQFHNLLSVTIPDSVTSIGDDAFYNCTKLTSVTIPDSVTSIGDWAFRDCTSLTSFTIPNRVTSIGECAFYSCTSLTSVTIPDSVKIIGVYAFRYCESLTSVTIGDSVTSIGNWAFCDCTKLTSVTIFNPNCRIYDSADTISPTAVIRGYDGSTAKSYARKYNRTFELITECTHEKTETIPAVAATCTKGGFTTGTRCAVCRTVLVAPVATPAAHNHKPFVTPPTCEDRGFTVYICTCGDVYVTDYVSTIPHSYTSEITTPATHTTEGVKTFTCSACGDTYTEPVAKLADHDYKAVVTAPTCTAQGYTTYTCECGEAYVADYTDKLDHSYTSEITTPATHLKEGVETYTCECGDTYTKPVAKLEGHTYTSVVTAPTCTAQGYTTYTCECGEAYVADYVAPHGEHTDADKDGLCDHCKQALASAVVVGDVDGDDEVTSSDARLALRVAVKLETLTEEQIKAADVDKDGEITSSDARLILRVAVGLETL